MAFCSEAEGSWIHVFLAYIHDLRARPPKEEMESEAWLPWQIPVDIMRIEVGPHAIHRFFKCSAPAILYWTLSFVGVITHMLS